MSRTFVHFYTFIRHSVSDSAGIAPAVAVVSPG